MELLADRSEAVFDGGGDAGSGEVDCDVAVVFFVLRAACLAVFGHSRYYDESLLRKLLFEFPKFLGIHARCLCGIYKHEVIVGVLEKFLDFVVCGCLETDVEVSAYAIFDELEFALDECGVFLVGDEYRLAEVFGEVVGEFETESGFAVSGLCG